MPPVHQGQVLSQARYVIKPKGEIHQGEPQSRLLLGKRKRGGRNREALNQNP